MGGSSSKSDKAITVGNIKMYFNKAEYVPGEVVEGNIILTLTQDLLCETIVVKFKASEQMIYKGNTHKPYTIIDRVAQMIQINKKLSQGSHTFQFQYQLPNVLQPSLYLDKANDAMQISQHHETDTNMPEKIRFTLMYMMVCELEIKDSGIHDLENLNIMKIGSSQNNQPIIDQFSDQVSNFFGNYGLYKQKLFIQRSEFNPGETIPIKLSFENSGKKPLKQILVKLIREQSFFNQEGKQSKVKELKIAETELKQVIPGRTVKDNVGIDFKIPNSRSLVLPSYQGGAFKIRYYLQFVFTFNGACCTEIQTVKNVPVTVISKSDRRISEQE